MERLIQRTVAFSVCLFRNSIEFRHLASPVAHGNRGAHVVKAAKKHGSPKSAVMVNRWDTAEPSRTPVKLYLPTYCPT